MIKNPLILKMLNDRKVIINARKDDFQRVEIYYYGLGRYDVRRYGVRMIIDISTVYLSKDVEPCSRREAVNLYTYLLDELDKDTNVIDLRPVLQDILDNRKEEGCICVYD